MAATLSSSFATRGTMFSAPAANKAGCNEHEERYLIVTCMVITDVPEPFCPLPVAVMAKASLPLYLAFAVYW